MANEKRLIDANALQRELEEMADFYHADYLFVDAVMDAIDNAPAVEAMWCEWQMYGSTKSKDCKKGNAMRKAFFTDHKKEWAFYCWMQGYSMDEIAESLGVSRSLVWLAIEDKRMEKQIWHRKRPALSYDESWRINNAY